VPKIIKNIPVKAKKTTISIQNPILEQTFHTFIAPTSPKNVNGAKPLLAKSVTLKPLKNPKKYKNPLAISKPVKFKKDTNNTMPSTTTPGTNG
jgi:hypothetical protein